MRHHDGQFQLSASDLSRSLSCRHLTALDMGAARGEITRPPRFEDPLVDILIERGKEHERQYVAQLAASGKNVVDLNHIAIFDRDAAVAKTMDAMRAGADIIVQAGLALNEFYGRADILQKVDKPSTLGDWSYEVADTKLTSETRGSTILQLVLYTEMLAAAQGATPEWFHVVTPDPKHPVHSFRTDDYGAYFRLIKGRLRATITRDYKEVAEEHYPEPVDYCDYCDWRSRCTERRRADDHISFVANITRAQRRELAGQNVTTLTGLAELPVPIPFKPSRGAVESYARAREQARLQLESRHLDTPLHQLLGAIVPGTGLARLPAPSPGDVFLDLEGDPFAAEGGREYLFGVATVSASGSVEYQSFWGATERDERMAFEAVMDLISDRLATYPEMHIYHYAPYEPSTFHRLTQRHASRADALDDHLRNERFIDLYAVVKQSMLVGVERYSIKNLEPLYAFTRETSLDSANRALRALETALERAMFDAIPADVKRTVEGYNRDDCVSTLRLRDWLESVRAEAIRGGAEFPRPVVKLDEEPKKGSDEAAVVEALRNRLLADVPTEAGARTAEQQARWVLAHLLDWHRREMRSTFFDYYKLLDLEERELIDEAKAIVGLEFVERLGFAISEKTGKPTRTEIHRFRYPAQEMEIGLKGELKTKVTNDANETKMLPWGKVVGLDRIARTIDLEIGPSKLDIKPSVVFEHTWIPPHAMKKALLALGEEIADAGTLDSPSGKHRAFRDLLLVRPPRLLSGEFSGEDPTLKLAVDTVLALDHTTFAIQGPPGSGKTHTGAEMILALIAAGARVGVTANGHKAIRNLLAKIDELKGTVRAKIGHKCDDDDGDAPSWLTTVSGNHEARDMLGAGELNVLGGTAWLWARDEFEHSVDVLFVDEAGQMSLANVVAVSRAAKSLVLLGDPQQLEQPTKGSHPDGVGLSALEHFLGGHPTMPTERGMFLPTTYRMHPNVCRFTSELYYENKLMPKSGLEAQALAGVGEFDGAGLWLVPVEHEGNSNYSDEEVDAVERLVNKLTANGAQWINEDGIPAPLTAHEILVVSPYNAQVNRLQERLESRGVRVGTVDKFQGQEAPVVIYSMAASRPEDAPRGMPFLYSPNRFNVATSRAQCAAILVASPALFEPDCQTPGQMQLANGVCRYRELSTR